MADDGRVVFSIEGDNRPLREALDETTEAIRSESRRWTNAAEESGDDISHAFGRAFDVERIKDFAINAGKELLKLGKEAINAASDLEEVQNVVNATFGEDSGKIDAWARKAGEQFGLTETQAKRFASTLGAMAKSSGMAGPEIMKMSTDLAGLAADMASFYNLDFDSAFQKIQSGISGQTEPLKQLGINMSTANLEAFALQQGLTKTFAQMDQGEQIMLRYQYIMQATADAQGDFARTSNGYANGMRMLETNIESLKTKLGETLLPTITSVVTAANNMLGALTQNNEKTIFDDFNDISLDTETKIAEIESTAEKAQALVNILDQLNAFTLTDDGESAYLNMITGGVNALETTAPDRWNKLIAVLGNTGALTGLANAGTNIEALSAAINSDGASTEKAEAWKTLLGALADDAGALTALTGESAEDTKAWLETLAAGANSLDPQSAEGWDKLKQTFMAGFTGGNSETVLSGLFGASDEYAEYLTALGIETGDVADAQAMWLNICKQLVGVIPGLSSIINTETGEVEGGTKALQDYITAWRETEILQATLADIGKKRQALSEQYGDRYSLYAEYLVAQAEKERLGRQLTMMGMTDAEEAKIRAGWVNSAAWGGSDRMDERSQALFDWDNATIKAEKALDKYNQYVADYNAAQDILQRQEEAVQDKMGETADVTAQTAESFYLTGDAATAATNAMTGLGTALQAVNDYYDSTRENTETMVRSVVNGFGEIESPAEKARREVQDLTAQMANLEDTSNIQIKIADANNSIPTAENMLAGLNDQIAYMQEYQKRIITARQMGYSEELLASLSDGSLESYDYLGALTSATEQQVQDINAAFSQAEAGKEGFTDMLTMQRLKADEVFQGLVADANAMVTDLDMSDGAQTAMESTLQGLVEGIAAKLPDLTTEVDLVLAQLARLDLATGFSFGGGHIYTSFTPGSGILNSGGNVTIASNAKGLDYVPFDGYLSILHEGESILTAAEAQVWRNFRYGGASTSNSIDYDALGGVMRDNVSAGGNVYLDGRTVGRVISASQANSYRNLERSGWQG